MKKWLFLFITICQITYSQQAKEIELLTTVIKEEPHLKILAKGTILKKTQVLSRLSKTMKILNQGEIVGIVKEIDDYYKIIYPVKGYVLKNHVKIIKPEAKKVQPNEKPKYKPIIEKPKKKEKLSERKVENKELPSNKLYYNYSIGIKFGWPFIMGHIGDSVDTNFPYIGVFWKNNIFYKSLFYEFEVGYFGHESDSSKTFSVGSSTANYLPMTISFLYEFQLYDWLYISPKAGLGYMLYFASADNGDSQTSSYFLFKLAPEVKFQISEQWAISVENTLLFGIQAANGNLGFYYIPNAGVHYQF